nr:Gag-Pol polyprotein [Tanacetum cinerariifolium]
CDNRTKFKNSKINQFCQIKGIKREFSVARTPQQNGVAKKKNRTLIKAARTMLADFLLPTMFWAKAVNTACYVHNRVLVTKPHNKTPYELLIGSGPKWLFDIDSLTKSMNYEPVTVGNQSNGDAGDVDEISRNDDVCQGNEIKIDSSTQAVNAANPSINTASTLIDVGAKADTNNLGSSTVVSTIPTTRVHKDHLKEQIIGDPNLNTKTIRMINFSEETAMALKDPSWIEAMQKDLLQFRLQDVWTLVDLPYEKRAIGSKWVFRNKLDERGIVFRNKVRLVAQEHTQEEGIYHDEVFTLVARIEAIRLFLEYASFKDFIVYQMDMKSAFLYGKIEEEVYVCQPPGFKDLDFPDKVYKVKKALYGLHQAPRANMCFACVSFQTTPQMVINSPCLTDKKELASPGQTKTEKPTESEGFKLSIDFLNRSSVKYVLTVHLTNHTSCIKKFWTTTKVKKVDDEVRIQALVDGKRVNIKESSIRRTLSAKTTSWNEFSSTMASAIICLATNQKFNFSRVGTRFSREVTSLVANILKKHKPKRKYTEEPEVPPTESQAEQNIPLPSPSHYLLPNGEDSLKLKELMDFYTSLSNKVLDLESKVIDIKSTYQARIEKLESMVERASPKERETNRCSNEVSSSKEKAFSGSLSQKEYDCVFKEHDLDHQEKVLSMIDINDEEPADVKEVLKVVKATKLITEVVTTARVDFNAASIQDTPITAAEATKVSVLRKRRGVIIQDPEKTTTTVTVQPKVQTKDKGKAILIEEPKPLIRQEQIELDEEVARHLETELNANVDWNAVIDQVQRREKLTDAVMKYQALKRKPLPEAQARRNMIVYLKNMVGYKMDYFKGMSYDEIIPLF